MDHSVRNNKPLKQEADPRNITRQEQCLQGANVFLSVLFTVGSQTIFSACAQGEDGSFMTCHYAGLVLTALGVVLLLIALAGFFWKDRQVRTGLALASLPVEVLVLLTPGTLVRLCMMPDMHCRSAMRTAAILFGLVMLVASVLSLAVTRRNGRD